MFYISEQPKYWRIEDRQEGGAIDYIIINKTSLRIYYVGEDLIFDNNGYTRRFDRKKTNIPIGLTPEALQVAIKNPKPDSGTGGPVTTDDVTDLSNVTSGGTQTQANNKLLSLIEEGIETNIKQVTANNYNILLTDYILDVRVSAFLFLPTITPSLIGKKYVIFCNLSSSGVQVIPDTAQGDRINGAVGLPIGTNTAFTLQATANNEWQIRNSYEAQNVPIFGQFAITQKDTTARPTSNSTLLCKQFYTTPNLPLGNYRVEADCVCSNSSASGAFVLELILNPNPPTLGQPLVGGTQLLRHDQEVKDIRDTIVVNLNDELTGVSGVQTIALGYAQDRNGTAIFQDSKIYFYRIS